MEPRAQNTSDPSYNKNLRLPPRVQPCQYPYHRITHFRDGSILSIGEETYNSHHTHIHALGTFEEKHPSGGFRSLVVDSHHHYVTAGKTTTTDDNHHDMVNASTVSQTTQDHYHEQGNDHVTAIGGNHAHLVGGTSHQHRTGVGYESSADHKVEDHNDGSHYHNVAGDRVSYVGGTKYQAIGGEYGINVPNGNFDIAVGNNCQINTVANVNIVSGSVMTITATTSMTITVGNTKIVLTPNSLDFYSSAIGFHKV